MRVLILGAGSAIAQATARRFAAEGASLFLVARDAGQLAAIADDLRVRGAAAVGMRVADMDAVEGHAAVLAAAQGALSGIDVILVAWGVLPDQAACERDPDLLLATWHTNATATIAFLARAAEVLELQRQGTLAVITSVAGERGRRSNYAYGAAKAAVSTFLSGLRARLHRAGVTVLDLRPGPVDTPMTAHVRKGPLFIDADTAGAQVHRAILARRDLAYIPGRWRWIMLLVRAVPEPVMKRLSLKA